ncbi:hypothetical protein MtrunA17_Chr2g0285941 [Medicago truncatula]|uniref:Uncharacterized protein n=1 Tax=Medicago truncatula TaxID=3880 RepID=A0A396J6T7_MEDTR|nr:hypothetical protein MtrunA17_Chr2g0285941 [Medicago truncatula]
MIKLNGDDECKRNSETPGCGGLFCNLDEHWIKYYNKKIGSCDTPQAKM